MLNEEFTVTEPALLARFAAGAERRLQQIQTAIESLATGQIDPASLDLVIASSQELKESTLIIGFERIHALLTDVQSVAEQMAEGKVQPSAPVREALGEAARVLQSLLLAYRDERLKRVPYPRGEVDESDLLSKIEQICDPVPAASLITEKVAKPPEMLQDMIPDESSPVFEEVQEADEYIETDETEKDSAPAKSETTAVVPDPMPHQEDAEEPAEENPEVEIDNKAEQDDIPDTGDLLIDQLLQGVEQDSGTPTFSMEEIEGEHETLEDEVSDQTEKPEQETGSGSERSEVPDPISGKDTAPEVRPNLEASIEDEPEETSEQSLDDILNAAPEVQPNLEAPTEDEPEETSEPSLDDILNAAPEVQPNLEAPTEDEPEETSEPSLDDILNAAPEVQPNLEAPVEDEPEETSEPSLDDILNAAPEVQPNVEAPAEDAQDTSLDDILNAAPDVQPNLEAPDESSPQAAQPDKQAEEQDLSLQIDDPEILSDYIVESQELIERLETELEELDARPDDPELMNSIFRCAHTVKGTSSFIGFKQMTSVTHKLENVLDRMRSGKLNVTEDIRLALLDGQGAMADLLEMFGSGEMRWLDVDQVLHTLAMILDPSTAPPPQPDRPKPDTVKPDSKTNVPKPKIAESLRVDVDKLDAMNDLVGELVLGRNRMALLLSKLASTSTDKALVREINDGLGQISRTATELQSAAMKTRMVRIDSVLGKFNRMVRDLSREKGKKVKLVIEGGETEVDKSVAEVIGDPLVHMIRNSIDHGIGAPAERVENGKFEQGTILLKAFNEGSDVIITVRDDGRGIDADKLKSKAIEKGILSESEASAMEKAEALMLIFRPGFSTAEQVTSTSGRGVGMDVVKTNVENLSGEISMESDLGQGTEFRILLPMRLAITESLIVRCADQEFAIPLTGIEDVVRIHAGQVITLEGRRVFRHKDRVLVVKELCSVLGGVVDEVSNSRSYLVVLTAGGKRVGVLVDRIVASQEIVTKPIPEEYFETPGVTGCTILGDGQIRLVLAPSILTELVLNAVDTKVPAESES